MEKHISQIIAEGSGEIETLIQTLQNVKLKGATHYRFDHLSDRGEEYHDLKFYKILSSEEQKKQEIEYLEERLKRLKNK